MEKQLVGFAAPDHSSVAEVMELLQKADFVVEYFRNMDELFARLRKGELPRLDLLISSNQLTPTPELQVATRDGTDVGVTLHKIVRATDPKLPIMLYGHEKKDLNRVADTLKDPLLTVWHDPSNEMLVLVARETLK